MRKVIFILLLSMSARTLISCCKTKEIRFQWSKAMLSNMDVSTNAPLLPPRDSSTIKDYGFRLELILEQVASYFTPDFGVNSSYALSCLSDYQNKDSVTAIQVITRYDFDAGHPAGSSLNDYLLCREGFMRPDLSSSGYSPVSQGVTQLNIDGEYISPILDFRFANVTPLLRQHRFILTLSFKSGRILSDSTEIKLY